MTRTDPPAPPAGPVDRLLDATAGRLVGPAFGLGSFVRRARVFHPRGRTFAVTVDVPGDESWAGTVFGERASHHGLLRLSRGAGVPEPLPDLLGRALRVDLAAGAQDLLLLSSAPAPGTRHVLVPARDYAGTHYSSISVFRLAGQTVVLGARAAEGHGPLARLDEVSDAARRGLHIDLLVATPLGPWTTVGTVTVHDPVPAEQSERLRFTPFHRAGGLEPVGLTNVVRRRAYADSQAARPT
ncbi:MAG: hypothetical protein AVDCRST_MAG54-1865 [uncultured Actinomycetospora sp.]|uniref:Phosphodiesterase n=1 Tax=uncultured Actinomycetospora sp. TaxID=1135996 RepID=A0A6J4ICY7_9PSEU|nr:MAG: hypothetical protein AVDCRST_MAG54-1865 [uncultured Actinomycetospora sp.]